MQTLRIIISSAAAIDSEASRAVRRLEIALSSSKLSENPEENVTQLNDLNWLKERLLDLTRENLVLRYKVENPDFSLRDSLEDFPKNIRDSIASGEVNITDLKSVYNLRFFEIIFSPDYIKEVCNCLINTFEEQKLKPSNLWLALVSSKGIITQEILDTFDISMLTDKQI